MAIRKGWDALSPGYRQRLENAGLSRTEYEAGESIKKARGHERTPERPIQKGIFKDFPDYFNNRSQKIRDIEAKKQRIFGGSLRWDAIRSHKAMEKKPPTMRQLDWALSADDSEIIDAIREDPETFRWLGYH
jgi:hypothetical protein